MPPLESRRSERIDYHAPVELLAHAEGAGMPSCVLARALDLGAGGMQLCAPVQMEVGAHVTCRMTLDGRPAALPGRVAWLRERDSTRRDDGHGMGICFDPLESDQSALLQHVVARSSAGFRPITLHFARSNQPLTTNAQATESGLRVMAELPILARGTEVSFRLDEEGPLFAARIGDAVLTEERGARRLLVEVDVIDGDSPRFRRSARYGYAEEIQAAEQAAAAVVAATEPSEASKASAARDRTTVATTRPRTRAGAGWAVLASATVGVALMTWIGVRSDQHATRLTEFVVRPRPPVAPNPLRLDEPDPIESMPLPRGAAEPRPAPVVTNRSSVPLDTQAETLGHTANQKADTDPPRSQNAAPEPAGGALVGDGAAANAAATQPVVSIDGDQTLVRIPFTGSLDGMKARIWAAPHALAVDLPHGSTSLAQGRYPIGQGEVTALQLNSRSTALLVRVKVSGEIARYDVAEANGGLELRVTRASTPEAQPLLTPAAFRKDGPH